MKIIFYSNQLSERGTETALIEYAYASRDILNFSCVLAFPKDRIFDRERYNILKNDFTILELSSNDELKKYIKDNSIDLLYVIAPGRSHDIADDITECKTFVHCVFSTARKHGTYYVAVHNWLNKAFHTHYKVLPHIVRKASNSGKDLRDEISIPKNSLVFGSYGAKDKFNIDFVRKTIKKIAETNSNIFFIFMNFENFMKKEFDEELNNIIFLEGSTNSERKVEFINTCDAMLHARLDGETFGLSVAEFSVQNKPVITFKPNLKYTIKDNLLNFLNKRRKYDRAHIMNLGKMGFYYKDSKSLEKILLNFSDLSKRKALKYYKKNSNGGGYECYDVFSKKFAPERIIQLFKNIITNGKEGK